MELVEMMNGEATTTSNEVAKKFGKSHDKVMRDIAILVASLKSQTPKLAAEMFVFEEYLTQRGRRYRRYRMNRDGFALLAMGFNGEKALGFKLDFISAFNELNKAVYEVGLSAYAHLVQMTVEQKADKEIASAAGTLLNNWKSIKPLRQARVDAALAAVQLALPFGTAA